MDPTKDEKFLNDFEDVDVVQNEDTARVVDHIAERQLCRKFDMRLMPVLAIMCEFFLAMCWIIAFGTKMRQCVACG
jgi:hypothetical protein